MKVPRASEDPGSERSHPAVEVTPWMRIKLLGRRKIPERAEPIDPIIEPISGD
jgi:hypothetical protein